VRVLDVRSHSSPLLNPPLRCPLSPHCRCPPASYPTALSPGALHLRTTAHLRWSKGLQPATQLGHVESVLLCSMLMQSAPPHPTYALRSLAAVLLPTSLLSACAPQETFYGASAFNQPLDWDTRSLTNLYVSHAPPSSSTGRSCTALAQRHNHAAHHSPLAALPHATCPPPLHHRAHSCEQPPSINRSIGTCAGCCGVLLRRSRTHLPPPLPCPCTYPSRLCVAAYHSKRSHLR
jgi:hypothetical protein